MQVIARQEYAESRRDDMRSLDVHEMNQMLERVRLKMREKGIPDIDKDVGRWEIHLQFAYDRKGRAYCV